MTRQGTIGPLAVEGQSMFLQLTGKFVQAVTLAAMLLACVPLEQQHFNDPVFALRSSPAGLPTYAETVKYIDDGLRYVDPTAAFFISPDGRMCFRGASPTLAANFFILYSISKRDWCLHPTTVSRVHSIETGHLSLSCKHANPQCINEIGYLYHAANTIHVYIVPSDREKSAIEHLIYLMGGNVGDNHLFKSVDRPGPHPF